MSAWRAASVVSVGAIIVCLAAGLLLGGDPLMPVGIAVAAVSAAWLVAGERAVPAEGDFSHRQPAISVAARSPRTCGAMSTLGVPLAAPLGHLVDLGLLGADDLLRE